MRREATRARSTNQRPRTRGGSTTRTRAASAATPTQSSRRWARNVDADRAASSAPRFLRRRRAPRALGAQSLRRHRAVVRHDGRVPLVRLGSLVPARRAGLHPGDRLLDLATGTGVVARAGSTITQHIVGADPSIGMLRAGPTSLTKVQATSEALPFADASFDFITIGFALRHFADLDGVFRECRRILRPGGRILILEITAPESRLRRALLGAYMGALVPALMTAVTFRAKVGRLMRYYWATTRDCVRPDAILGALRGAGFDDVTRTVSLSIFSEYSARLLPASPAADRSESAGTRAATSPGPRESR